MAITIHIDALDPADLRRQLTDLLHMNGAPRAESVVPTPTATPAEEPDAVEAQRPDPGPSNTRGLTVDQLVAGMTLKPTATSSLGDGAKVSNGDYLLHEGEVWHIVQTYRGSVVAVNEAGVANILQTANCAEHTGARPTAAARAGTAAALIADQASTDASTAAVAADAAVDAGALVSPEVAQDLRVMATEKVSNHGLPVNAVFEKLQAIANVKAIDMLTVEQAEMFREWISAVGTKPETDGKFGF